MSLLQLGVVWCLVYMKIKNLLEVPFCTHKNFPLQKSTSSLKRCSYGKKTTAIVQKVAAAVNSWG